MSQEIGFRHNSTELYESRKNPTMSETVILQRGDVCLMAVQLHSNLVVGPIYYLIVILAPETGR